VQLLRHGCRLRPLLLPVHPPHVPVQVILKSKRGRRADVAPELVSRPAAAVRLLKVPRKSLLVIVVLATGGAP
jgi:hypothetical protein